MKPATELQQLAHYPFTIDLLPRFGDMDVLRHLNNVALSALYEDARFRFQLERLQIGEERSARGFLASVNVSYLREAHYPDPLRFGAGVGRIGRTSYEIVMGGFQNHRCVGTCSATVVMVDKDARPVAMTPALRARLDSQQLRRS